MDIRAGVDEIVRQVTTWDGVTSAPHRFGGIEFNLGGVEIGHIHRNGMVDIPYARRLREPLVAADEAEPHHILPETGWITFYVRREDDVEQAVRLFRLSYLQKSRRRGLTGEALRAELETLGFDAVINAVLLGTADTEAQDDES